jgi:uncharacterized membrane protein
VSIRWTVLAAVLAMSVVTYATRLAGLLLVKHLVLSPRASAAFEAIPAAVLIAVIAPMLVATGKAETAAAVLTILAATRLPLVAVVAVGVVSVVALRTLLG